MPIQLVQETEKLTYEWEESKIYYRRVPTPFQNKIIQINTKKGKQDWVKINDAFLKYLGLGWDNVQANGEVIDFKPELMTALPGDVVDDLLALSGAAGPEGARKNSKSSSSSK